MQEGRRGLRGKVPSLSPLLFLLPAACCLLPFTARRPLMNKLLVGAEEHGARAFEGGDVVENVVEEGADFGVR
jgi:hypothetical protein